METNPKDEVPLESDATSQVSKKLNKILETRIENDKDTLEALKELSTFFTENTFQARRNLRSKIEKRSLSINEEFLSAFRDVKEALDSIYVDVQSMNMMLTDMNSRLQTTKAQTSSLINQTTKLQAESRKISMEQDLAERFLQNFQLSSYEQAILKGGRDAPLSFEFFTILEKVKKIHRECNTLMQSGHQTAALEIMEQMTHYQESALERLYRWTQTHCRNIDSAENMSLLPQAMSYIQERPILLKYVLDEYATARRSIMVKLFIDALTKGSPTGTPGPIEMHADDPKRYVGDMLAWLHQSIPIEEENLQMLMKSCKEDEKPEHISSALSNITEGVCHPLKVRVEHIMAAAAGPVVLFAVASLLRYYLDVLKQVIPGSLLEITLNDLHQLGMQTFLTSLKGAVNQLCDKIEPPPPDLSPPPGLGHALAMLKDVLSVTSVGEDRKNDLLKIVALVTDPLLQAINLSASRLPTTDMAVYLLNCIYHIQSTLSLYEFMDERLERLQAQSDAQLDTLTSEQASSLVANLNLGPIYTILQEQDVGPLSSVPGMEPACLNSFLTKLDSFLAVPDMLSMHQIRLLLSSNHRHIVQHRSHEVIVAIYRQLYKSVHNPVNQYQNPTTLMPRTPEQVAELLM
ncbi:conserved oligomeric Golgi complex subunit 6 [Hetaerina americana]|uniref:conserved oligomeric Golgi complex subunit 6 n=1 Tax=Hetaerina americana TaxID=62018 RepID=UPI003A7F6191